jgi:protein-L-isoaspartate O-methyltransferase
MGTAHTNPNHRPLQGVGLGSGAQQGFQGGQRSQQYDEEQVDFSGQQNPQQLLDLQQNDEIVISAAMQQLREPGVLIVAHGSRGKPKTVRLQLTESAITWRTETRKKGSKDNKAKMGKLHRFR